MRKTATFASMASVVALTSLVLSGCGTSNSNGANSNAADTTNVSSSTSSTSSNSTTSSNNQPSGTLTVYGALTAENGQAIVRAFEAYNPNAKVNMVTAGTGDLITRINAEQKAGGVKADVLLLADPTAMAPLNQKGILASYTPPEAKQLPSSLKGTDWVAAFTFHNIILYHKGMSLPAPKSLKDLTNSSYKGHLEIGDPSYSGTTLGLVGYLNNKYGKSYFQSLKQNQVSVVSSTNTVGTDVASGREDVGITLDSVANTLVKQKSPVVEVWPSDGAVPVPAPISIVRGSDNSLSEDFVNWLLSPSGQKVVASVGLAPAVGKSDLVPSNASMASVNWSSIGSSRQDILSEFKTVLG